MNNNTTAATQRFVQGASVYDVDGTHVGTVSEQSAPGQYLAVEKGTVVPANVYVPVAAIRGTAPDGGIVLGLHEDELSQPEYKQPPTTGPTTTSATVAT